MNTRREFFKWLASFAALPLLPKAGEIVKQEPEKHGVWVALYCSSKVHFRRGRPMPVEVSGDGYARQFVSRHDWQLDPDGSAYNKRPVDFGMAKSSWGQISHAAMILPDGVIFPVELSVSPVLINAGSSFRFDKGSMVFHTDVDNFGPLSATRMANVHLLDRILGRVT